MHISRRKVIVGVLLALVLVGGLIWLISVRSAVENMKIKTPIKGYGQQVKNLPDSYKNSIEAALHSMIEYNNTPSTSDTIGDATIRNGSTKQQEIVKGSSYSGSFIVDIPSIHQSYRVQYEYSSDPQVNTQSGYPVLVSCLPKEDLIYGDFTCKERYTSVDNKAAIKDPIVGKLPYASLSFRLTADVTSGKLKLFAELRIPESDLKGNETATNQVVSQYKNEVLSWIKSQSLNPDGYDITYSYLDNGRVRGLDSQNQL